MTTRKTVMRPLGLIIFLSFALPLGAQQRVSADVTVKQVQNGRASTTTKSVCCTNDGRMVAITKTKEGKLYIFTNIHGETRIYNQARNEVMSDNSGSVTSTDELLQVFLLQRIDDMGFTSLGYDLVKTEHEGSNLIKIFEPKNKAAQCARIKLVMQDYLPIYCAYLDRKGKVITKTYYSKYELTDRFMFPHRVTEVTYLNAKDSVVKLDLYSNIKVNTPDPAFDITIPADAKIITTAK
ncbi:MAG: hypothetical protein KBT44_07090 [Bacteroidales bacterium]|nr:hypothetical protein [Candidatus Equibacterium intestinale]